MKKEGIIRKSRIFFKEYLKQHSLQITNASEDVIIDYLWERKLSGKSGTTVFREQEAIKSFYKFLFMEGIVSLNPARELKSPKLEKYLPDTLTIQEIEKLLSAPDLQKKQGPLCYGISGNELYVYWRRREG